MKKNQQFPKTLSWKADAGGHNLPILCWAFNSKRQEILSCDLRTARVWNFSKEILRLRLDKESKFSHTTYTPVHVASCMGNLIKIWKIVKARQSLNLRASYAVEPIRTIFSTNREHESNNWITSMSIDENVDRIFGVCGNDVHVWNMSTGDCISILPNLHSGGVTCVFFDPQASYLLTGGMDGIIKVWHFMKTMANLTDSLVGHMKKVNHILLSTDRKSLFSSSDDGTIRNWDYSRALELDRYAYIITDPLEKAGGPDSRSGDSKGEGKPDSTGPYHSPPGNLFLIPETSETSERVILLVTIGVFISVFETYQTPSLLAETSEMVTMIQKTTLGSSHPHSLIVLSQDNSFNFFDDTLMEVYDEVIVSSKTHQSKKEQPTDPNEKQKLPDLPSFNSPADDGHMHREVMSFLHLEEYDMLLMGTNTGGIEYIQPRSAEYGEDARRHIVSNEDERSEKLKKKLIGSKNRKSAVVMPTYVPPTTSMLSIRDGDKGDAVGISKSRLPSTTSIHQGVDRMTESREDIVQSSRRKLSESIGNMSRVPPLPSSRGRPSIIEESVKDSSSEGRASARSSVGEMRTSRQSEQLIPSKSIDNITKSIGNFSDSVSEKMRLGEGLENASIAKIPEAGLTNRSDSSSRNYSARTANDSFGGGYSYSTLPKFVLESMDRGFQKSYERNSKLGKSESVVDMQEQKTDTNATSAGQSQKIRYDAFLTATNEGTISYWSLHTIKDLSSQLSVQHQTDVIIDMLYVPQYDIVITACINGTVDFLDAVDLSSKSRFSCNQEGISCFHLIESGYIACGFESGTLELWKYKLVKGNFSFKFKQSISAHSDKITSIASVQIDLTKALDLPPNKKELAPLFLLLTSSADQTVKVWDSSQLRLIRTISLNGVVTQILSFYEEGEIVVAVANTIKVISIIDIVKSLKQKAIIYAREFQKTIREDEEFFDLPTYGSETPVMARNPSPNFHLHRQSSDFGSRYDLPSDQHSENSMSQSPSMAAIAEKLTEIQPKIGIVPSFIPKLNEPTRKDDTKSDTSEDTVEWLEDVELNRLRQLEYEDTAVFSTNAGLKLQQSSFLKKARPTSILMPMSYQVYQTETSETSDQIMMHTVDSDSLSFSSKPSFTETSSILSRDDWDESRPMEKARPTFDSFGYNHKKMDKSIHSIRLDPIPGKHFKPKPIVKQKQPFSTISFKPKKVPVVLKPCTNVDKNLNTELDLDITLDRIIYDTLHHRIPVPNHLKFVKEIPFPDVGDPQYEDQTKHSGDLEDQMEHSHYDNPVPKLKAVPTATSDSDSPGSSKSPIPSNPAQSSGSLESQIRHSKTHMQKLVGRVPKVEKYQKPEVTNDDYNGTAAAQEKDKQDDEQRPSQKQEDERLLQQQKQLKLTKITLVDSHPHLSRYKKPGTKFSQRKGDDVFMDSGSFQGEFNITGKYRLQTRSAGSRTYSAASSTSEAIGPHQNIFDPEDSEEPSDSISSAAESAFIGNSMMVRIPSDQGFYMRAITADQEVFDRGGSRAAKETSPGRHKEQHEPPSPERAHSPKGQAPAPNVKVIIRRYTDSHNLSSVHSPSGFKGVASVAAISRDTLSERRASPIHYPRYIPQSTPGKKVSIVPTTVEPPEDPNVAQKPMYPQWPNTHEQLTGHRPAHEQGSSNEVKHIDIEINMLGGEVSPSSDQISPSEPYMHPHMPTHPHVYAHMHSNPHMHDSHDRFSDLDPNSGRHHEVVMLPDEKPERTRVQNRPIRIHPAPMRKPVSARPVSDFSSASINDSASVSSGKESIAKTDTPKSYPHRRLSIEGTPVPMGIFSPDSKHDTPKSSTPPPNSSMPEIEAEPELPVELPVQTIMEEPVEPQPVVETPTIQTPPVIETPPIIETPPVIETPPETAIEASPAPSSSSELAPDQSWKSFLRRQSRQFHQADDLSNALDALKGMETFAEEEPNSPPMSTPRESEPEETPPEPDEENLIPSISTTDSKSGSKSASPKSAVGSSTGLRSPAKSHFGDSVLQTAEEIHSMIEAGSSAASREATPPSTNYVSRLLAMQTTLATPSDHGSGKESVETNLDLKLLDSISLAPPRVAPLRRTQSAAPMKPIPTEEQPKREAPPPYFNWTGGAEAECTELDDAVKYHWLPALQRPRIRNKRLGIQIAKLRREGLVRSMSCGDMNIDEANQYRKEHVEVEGNEGLLLEDVAERPWLSKDESGQAQGSSTSPTRGSPTQPPSSGAKSIVAKRKGDDSKKGAPLIPPKQVAETKYTFFQLDEKVMLRLMRGDW